MSMSMCMLWEGCVTIGSMRGREKRTAPPDLLATSGMPSYATTWPVRPDARMALAYRPIPAPSSVRVCLRGERRGLGFAASAGPHGRTTPPIGLCAAHWLVRSASPGAWSTARSLESQPRLMSCHCGLWHCQDGASNTGVVPLEEAREAARQRGVKHVRAVVALLLRVRHV